MRIKNSLFPYPVLNSKSQISSYSGVNFSFDYDEEQDKEFYYLKNICIKLDDSNLINLLKNGEVSAAVVVECSRTIYRKSFNIGLEPVDVKIPINNLRGPIEVSCFMYAKGNIYNFHSNSFNKIYGDYSFKIDKFDIVAADDGYNCKVDYDEEQDNKISSIFVVIPSADEEADTMDIDLKRKCIKITLPGREYGFYTNMKNDSKYQNLFFAILAIPALSYALNKVQEDDYDNAILKYDWLRSVTDAYKKIYEHDISEDWKKLECDVAQKLLNNAVTKSIDDFFYLMIDQYRDRGGEYE